MALIGEWLRAAGVANHAGAGAAGAGAGGGGVSGAGAADGGAPAAASCTWCPLCQAAQAVGSAGPEVTGHLTDALAALLRAARALSGGSRHP